MTVKSSVSLTDQQYRYARALVEQGRFASVSAVVQQGIELLRGQIEDAEAERAALRAVLAERAGGAFVPVAEVRGWIEGFEAERREG